MTDKMNNAPFTCRFAWKAIVIALMCCHSFAQATTNVESYKQLSTKLAELFSQDESDISLISAVLLIEKHIDPHVDIDASLSTIIEITSQIKQLPDYKPTTQGKLSSIVQYIYSAGTWNNDEPYHYDLDDPLGILKPENSLLSNYLRTKKGNCVSMPLLVLAIGEKLGLDMSLSTAPQHYFVKLHDGNHQWNFEATSGGLKADSSYVKEFEISPLALHNKIYLQHRLTKKQTISLMLSGLARQYSQGKTNAEFNKAFELTDLMLKYYPGNVTAMIVKGNTWRNILMRDLKAFEEKRINMTPRIKKHFDDLLAQNLKWYGKAESFGWQEPSTESESRYLKMIAEAKKNHVN